jgi:signal transduction histidine kinase/DNA-binding response OmpR family regulator
MKYIGTEPNIQPKNSVSRRILKGILGAYLSFAIAITIIQTLFTYFEEKKQIAYLMETYVNTLMLALSEASWNLEELQIVALLQGLTANEEVSGIVVHIFNWQTIKEGDLPAENVYDQFIASSEITAKNASLDVKKDPSPGYAFDILFENKDKRYHLGVGKIYINPNSAYLRTADIVIVIFASALVKTVVLCLIAYFILVRFVARPVNDLAEKFRSLDLASQDIPQKDIDFVESEFRDELWLLGKSFSEMQGAIVEKNITIENHVEHLQALVDERTSKLNDTMEKLKKSNQIKAQFMATMSHEIRTPMNGVLGMAELMQDTPLDKTQKHYIEIMVSCGRSLLSIINDILDFSKIEAGKMKLELVDVDVASVMSEMCNLFSLKKNETGVELASYIDDDVPRVIRADQTRLLQILINLLTNAYKFTTEGEIFFHIKMSLSSPGKIIFLIYDTGIGISGERLREVFEPFEQAEAGTTRKFGGTGLGLSICELLARLMGGEIRVDSKPSYGSIFWLSIPMKEISGVVKFGDVELSSIRNKKILYLDSSVQYGEAISRQLKKWGASAFVSNSESDVLDKLQTRGQSLLEFDLVIINFNISDVAGVMFSEMLKVQSKKMNVPLILFVIKSDYSNCDDIGELESFPYFEKPVLPENLLAVCNVVFRGKLHVGFNEISSYNKKQDNVVEMNLANNSGKGEGRLLNVMVVDDNEVNRLYMKKLLTKLGHSCLCVGDGSLAVEEICVKKNVFDMVLMDYEMPEMNGVEATIEIRRYEQLHNLPAVKIIALTAHALEEYRKYCMQAGMDDILLKPLSFESLKVVLRDQV